ncbi:MAG: hypothetical protein HN623_05225, partial [Bdellovibrionales bacterium]|nr:hypothetical protein [Bdellovibrionales bacterium]
GFALATTTILLMVAQGQGAYTGPDILSPIFILFSAVAIFTIFDQHTNPYPTGTSHFFSHALSQAPIISTVYINKIGEVIQNQIFSIANMPPTDSNSKFMPTSYSIIYSINLPTVKTERGANSVRELLRMEFSASYKEVAIGKVLGREEWILNITDHCEHPEEVRDFVLDSILREGCDSSDVAC